MTKKNRCGLAGLGLALACGLLFAAARPAAAQDGRGSQDELAVCGHNGQDRAACIREAGAARQAARAGQLTGAPDDRTNALARCSLHPPAERAECEARVLGSGQTRIEGSVQGGGLIRETVTPVPAPQQ
ncbi:MAG: hypothetical protein QM586_09185 [Xenophilus sp.]